MRKYGKVTLTELKDIQKRMTNEGYSVPTLHEAFVYKYEGPKFLNKIIGEAARCSSLEAEFLEIDRHSKAYKLLNLTRRAAVVHEVTEMMLEHNYAHITISTFSDAQIQDHIRRKYSGPLAKELSYGLEDILSDEPKEENDKGEDLDGPIEIA